MLSLCCLGNILKINMWKLEEPKMEEPAQKERSYEKWILVTRAIHITNKQVFSTPRHPSTVTFLKLADELWLVPICPNALEWEWGV